MKGGQTNLPKKEKIEAVEAAIKEGQTDLPETPNKTVEVRREEKVVAVEATMKGGQTDLPKTEKSWQSRP